MKKLSYNKIAIIAGLAYLFYFIKKKADAGKNLNAEPVWFAIDKQKTKKSGYESVFYKLAVKLSNLEPAQVKVKSAKFIISIAGSNFGTIESSTPFTVPAKGDKTVIFTNSIQTLQAIEAAKNILIDGMQPATVKGYIDTDLGKIKLAANISPSGEVSIISAPGSRPLLLTDTYFLKWKKHRQPTGTKIADVYKYMLNSINTGAKPHEFVIETGSGADIPGQIFLEQIKFLNFEPFEYSKN